MSPTPLPSAACVGNEQFDVVFTSHGTISWLPDLAPWARTVARVLKPGGLFFIADSHPFTWMFDETAEPELRFRFPYFDRTALRWEEKGSYAVPDADLESVSYSWQHTFAEIVGSLTAAGLSITSLREYPYLFWRWFPWMVKDDAGRVPPARRTRPRSPSCSRSPRPSPSTSRPAQRGPTPRSPRTVRRHEGRDGPAARDRHRANAHRGTARRIGKRGTRIRPDRSREAPRRHRRESGFRTIPGPAWPRTRAAPR